MQFVEKICIITFQSSLNCDFYLEDDKMGDKFHRLWNKPA